MSPALTVVLALLAFLSLGLMCWQWAAGQRIGLHPPPNAPATTLPPVCLLKPLKGCEPKTAECLRSWLTQTYPAPIQVLFGVASPDDPVVPLVQSLIREFPEVNAELIICEQQLGPNAKVSTLIQLEQHALHDLIVISDADVWASSDTVSQMASVLGEEAVGLANCFYALVAPGSFATHWEAVAINADFWTQVLQAQMLKPMDFALGAAMATRRAILNRVGGFNSLVDYLADDYQIGHKIAQLGKRISISPRVVECRSAPMSWAEAWNHQLRWARTIRACQPIPYFFSILSNATFWPLLFLAVTSWQQHSRLPLWLADLEAIVPLPLALFSLAMRAATARYQQRKLVGDKVDLAPGWMPWIKDLLQVGLWATAFAGNTVIWRGQRLKMTKGGRLLRKEKGR